VPEVRHLFDQLVNESPLRGRYWQLATTAKGCWLGKLPGIFMERRKRIVVDLTLLHVMISLSLLGDILKLIDAQISMISSHEDNSLATWYFLFSFDWL
jgi:hypothetical protein